MKEEEGRSNQNQILRYGENKMRKKIRKSESAGVRTYVWEGHKMGEEIKVGERDKPTGQCLAL